MRNDFREPQWTGNKINGALDQIEKVRTMNWTVNYNDKGQEKIYHRQKLNGHYTGNKSYD